MVSGAVGDAWVLDRSTAFVGGEVGGVDLSVVGIQSMILQWVDVDLEVPGHGSYLINLSLSPLINVRNNIPPLNSYSHTSPSRRYRKLPFQGPSEKASYIIIPH